MSKFNRVTAFLLSAAFWLNATNYDVVVNAVSAEVQKFREEQLQNTENQPERDQIDFETTEEPEATIVAEITDVPETVMFADTTTLVSEPVSVTDVTNVPAITTVTNTTEVTPVTTNIVTIQPFVTTADDMFSSNAGDITYDVVWNEDTDISSYKEISKNTKVNGGLTVKSNSTLHVKNNTVIEVNGDLVIEQGALVNVSENDIKIIVNGDVIVEGRMHISNSSIFIKGNLIEKGSSEIQGSGSVVLVGNKQQIIDTHSQINRIVNKNTSEKPLVFINSLNFVMYEDNGKGITSYVKDEEGNYTVQKCPVKIENRLNFFVRDYSNGGNPITDKELVIHGDLCIKSDSDINIAQQETDKVTLRIKGNLIQENGNLKTFNQKLVVEGNYELNNGTLEIMGRDTVLEVLGNMTLQGDSLFKMLYQDSKVIVNGDFTVKNNRVNELKNGVLEIKGDFTQEQNEENLKLINEGYNIDKNSLCWVNNHKVILNGSGRQNVTFKYPTLINSDKNIKTRRSQFATLELTKSFYEYNFTNDLSKEKIYEQLNEPYDEFYKNNGEPYRIRKSLEIPVSHLELVNANDHIYAIGGKDTDNTVRNEISRYDIENNTWSTVGYLDTRRMDYAAVAVNHDIYVFGGYDGTSVLNSIEVISQDGTSHTVSLNPDSTVISRRGHKAVYYNGKVYIMGGESEDGTPLNTLEVYDPVTNTVEIKKSMLTARKDFGAALYLDNDKFCIAVAGGENSDGILKSVEVYDFDSDEWTSKQDMLTARKGFGLEFLMGKLFAVGGISAESGNGTSYLNTAEGFDGETWVALKDDAGKDICTSESRGYFGSVAAYNSIFIAGGENPSVSSKFEQFMPLEIPGVRFKGNSKGLNGDFTQEETDFSFNSPVQNFSLNRVYNTQFKDEKSDFLGYGWKFNFESSIKEINDRAGKVNAIYLNVRKSPWGQIVGGVERGTVVSILGEVTDVYGNKWFNIAGKDEDYYVYANYVTEISNENENKAVEVTYPDGIKTYFVRGEDGKFTANFGTYDKLEITDNKYILTTKEQVVYTYSRDKNGVYRNTSVKDKYGNEIKISFSSDEVKITNSSGEQITVSKTDSGVKATDNRGRTVIYTVKDGELAEVTDVTGLKKTYEYKDNFITKIEETAGNRKITSCQVEYDKSGRIYRYTDAEGNISLNYYEDVYMDESNEVLGIAGDLRRCVVDPDGNETITKYSLVEKRPVLSVDAENGITKYRYEILYKDNYVDVTNLKDGDDLYKTYSEIVKGQYPVRETMTDSNSQTTVIEKDANGNVTKKTNTDGSYTDYKFDSKNNLLEETVRDKDKKTLSTTKYTYNESGFLTEVEYGTSGSNEKYVYDSNTSGVKGLVTEKITARSDSSVVTTKYTYYDDGQLESETTDGLTTYYAYVYDMAENDKEITLNNRKIVIDKPANDYEKCIFCFQVKLNPDGNAEITGYDKKYNPVRTTLSDSSGKEKSTSLVVYDEYGRKIKEISPEVYVDNAGTADALTEFCHMYKYNDAGMLSEETDAEGNTTKYKYDHAGNLLEQTEPNGTVYSYEYDNLYRLIRKSYTDDSGSKELESFSYERGNESSPYDKASKLIHTEKIDDTTELKTEISLDYSGRETRSETPYKITEKEYYGDGNLKRERVYDKSDNSRCVSDVLYFYNDRGLPDITLTGYKPGESYFISKNIYTLDGLQEYVISYLDAQEVNLTSPVLPKKARASVTKYEYDESGNLLKESTFLDEFTDISSAEFAVRTEYEYDVPNNTVTEKSGKIKTVYVNNYLDKTVTVKNIVNSEDIIASAAGTGNETELITENTYDRNGNLVKTRTPSGAVTEYSYDNLGRLTETRQLEVPSEDETGTLTESLSYNWAGSVTKKVLKFDDSVKSESEYRYDSRNNLILSADKVDGRYAVTAYEYNRAGLLTAEASPESFAGISTEDSLSEEVYSISAASGHTKYTYDNAGRLKTKEFVGKTYTLDGKSGAMKAEEDTFVISAFEYDANDNLIKEIDGEEYGAENRGKTYTYSGTGNILTERYPESDINNVIYEYDALGNIKEEKVLKGIAGAVKYAVTTTSYSQGKDGITEYIQKTFSSDEENISSAEQLLSLKTWKTDINGNVTEESLGKKKVQTEYNSLGFECKSVSEVDRYTENDRETVVNSEIKTLYDNEGNAVVLIRNSGIVEINKYDNLRRLVSTTRGKRPEGVADNQLSAENLTDSVTLKWTYDALGNVRYEYDGKGFKTEYQYDELGRLVNTIKRYGTDNVSEDVMTYDLDGNLTEETTVLNDIQTGKKSYLYDGLGRIVQKSDAVQESDETKIFPYEFIEYNKNSDQVKSFDAEYVLKEFKYNADRQLTKTKLAGVCTEELTYDYAGNVYTKKDGEENKTFYYYDVMDRLVKVSSAKGDETPVEIASYTYNAEGNISSKITGSKNKVTYEYTVSDEIKEVNSNGKIEKFFYNDNGKLLKSVDPAGNETVYTYDAQGQTVKEEVKTEGNIVISKSYTYDKNGNVLKSSVTENGKENVITRSYDELGRVTKKEATDSVTSEFIYDLFTEDNLLYEVTRYDNGESSSNVYDEFGRLKYVYSIDISEGADESKKTEYSYDDKGRRESIVYPNGAKSEYEYYDDNNVKILSNYIQNKDSKSDADKYKEIEKYEYTYYTNNTMSGKTETFDGVKQGETVYEYDNLLRLVATKETRNEEDYRDITYSYDDSGNRITEESLEKDVKTTKAYTYGEGNLLLGYTVTTGTEKTDEVKYEYDKNGNLVKEFDIIKNGKACSDNDMLNTQNTYNSLNQLVSSETSDFTVTNEYNAEGLRTGKEVISKDVDTTTKTYYTYEYDKVIFETNEQEPENYIWNVQGINLISRQVNGEMFYCMYNAHADITRMVDENGELAEKYYYDEWGVETETLRYGDVTGDGSVNSNDYLLLVKYNFGEISEFTVEQRIAADMNGDGNIDEKDVNILKQIILAAVKHCPADTNKDGFINEKNNIKYAGYFYDGETGLYYLNARFYDPETARFIQQDSYNGDIYDPLSLNLYTYGHNNPISYYDPTGHSIKSVLKKAVNTVKKAASTVTNTVKKAATSTASTVKKAATATKNAVVSASKEFRNDWQSGIDQLKQSGTAGKIFASYSEGVVHNLDNTVAGTVQLVKDPLGTVSESVNYFLADPLRNNPIAAAGTFCRDTAQAVYSKDWETVANKAGSATATVAVMGITGTLAEGGVSKLLSKGINIDKTLRLPMLEMYEYAGVGGFEFGVSTVSIPIKVSISANKVATAAGVTASAAAGQGIYYSNKFYNQSSGGGVSKGSLSDNGSGKSSGGGISKAVNSDSTNINSVPSIKGGEFNKWFNALSVDEFDALWVNKTTRKAIEGRLRSPGGMHEWHLVSRAPQFKNWGVSAEQIRDLRTAINDVEFVNPTGAHGQLGSTLAHNELLGIIDSSIDYDMFKRRLNNWSNYRLNGGIDSLPEGLRMK